MNLIENFFSSLGFDLKRDFISKSIPFFEENSTLYQKLKDSFYFYKAPNQTNTSFYLITTLLNSNELDEIRKFIWNENSADLIFYITNTENTILSLFFAKGSPKSNFNTHIIDSFHVSEEDDIKITNINKWQFDSGAFWHNYHKFLSKVKHKSIDRELVSTLKTLKGKLNSLLLSNIEDEFLREEIVQALIDRTLYIKYLEDSHIINSYFYAHYFDDDELTYKTLLLNNDKDGLNKLFKIIHKIFNNSLFSKPSIEEDYITHGVCELLHNSLGANLKTKQLRLFDFQFNVIPIEFISYIYEIFLNAKQKTGGIYYTPKKLAQLIIDDVIPSGTIGKVLDPSCGSGMFLIVAFQKLLENSAEDKFDSIESEIEFRTKLLSENIFGIEKEITAQRFTLFSLSLQIFRGIDPLKIRRFISKQLKENKEVSLFSKHSFFDNIICANSLSIQYPNFKNQSFDYIVGNPPFFEIKQTDEEISFINSYELELDNKTIKAKDVVGKYQISQCFLLKIKEWGSENTRYGFVSNSSNFYNDNSNNFQKFFYSTYCVEKIYELSRVKKILFEKAQESVVTLIFSNQNKENNAIEYYPVDLGIFSEKPFELLIIQEDTAVNILQNNLLNSNSLLRDFLIGNTYDHKLTGRIKSSCSYIKDFIAERANNKLFIHSGLQIAGVDVILKNENITREEYNKNKKRYLSQYVNKYTRKRRDNIYDTPLVTSKNISPFFIQSNSFSTYIKDTSFFRRKGYSEDIFQGQKILWGRIGHKITAIYSNDKLFFDFDIHVIKLGDSQLYGLITAILNSNLVNYYINVLLRKRPNDFHSKIGISEFKKIPVPRELDRGIVNQINIISKNLSEGKYGERQKDDIIRGLNELVFDLYELSYFEKQRIRDYFLPKTKILITDIKLEKYKATFKETVNMYLNNPVDIGFSKTDFNLIVAKVILNNESSNTPSADKVKYYMLNEIFEQNPNENFLASQEKIYGKSCVYILKKGININWTETKAYEDGREVLKYIASNEERIHKN